MLVRNKDQIPIKQKCGVYRLRCNVCPKEYIGQTGRSFDARIKEHVACIKYQRDVSSFAVHINEDKHNFDPEHNVEFLHYIPKGFRLNVAENMEIFLSKKGGHNLNEQVQFGSNLLFGAISEL